MPLFKKNHDVPVDTNYAGNPNDPNYAVASQYTPESNAYAGGTGPTGHHTSGVGTHLPGANTTTDYYDSPQNTQSTTYDHSTSGYNHQPGGAMNHNQPMHHEVGRGALASEPGHPMGGHMGTGMGATTAGTTGGLTGRDHHAPHTGTGAHNVHNTAPIGMTGATGGNMSAADARKLEMKGKAQQLAGMILSSQSMKAKGNAKEQEAAAIRHHQTNIATAESHEAQARLAREQAGQNPYH
ncbi:CsbD domain protein [Rhizoctonia solani 123E]|uniref:CsbD domain protein n=1 Tax=Rhizoctonia solani 123E TaxID=1423351 RepID=A0A074S7E8_9AGAM|nr:CsbD domain protein [Rhizoctonia solani 123E]